MTTATRPARHRRRHRDAGQVTAFTVVWLAAIVLLAGLVLDAGLAVSTKVHAQSVANAAARAGARQLDVVALRTTGAVRLDAPQARAAASDWLTRAGLPGSVTVTGNTVTVSITTARATQLLNLVGIDTIPVHATATADAIVPG